MLLGEEFKDSVAGWGRGADEGEDEDAEDVHEENRCQDREQCAEEDQRPDVLFGDVWSEWMLSGIGQGGLFSGLL